ncbi:MAG: RNA polymerase factor sigma-54 [Alphaproteobacteria bacterium]|nr:RNA polymerase factor sigma-54 [Alphaproteobacteria bacterium]
MAITQRQVLRQTQSLVMTPQLQQAIKLLQLPQIELAQFVEQEIETNPLLERADGDGLALEEVQRTRDAPESADRAGSDDLTAREHLPDSEVAPLDVDYDQICAAEGTSEVAPGPDLGSAAGSGGKRFEGDDRTIEDTIGTVPTLHDHLNAQLGLAFVDPKDRLIGVHLIDLIDEAGYFTGDLEAVAASAGCDLARVVAVFEGIQRFDPTGVGARSLAECLALQLHERDRLNPAMQAFLAQLDLLAANDITALCHACSVDREDVLAMAAEVRHLNPKPGLAFSNERIEPIVPDVFVRHLRGGGWAVELNSDALPRVLVNRAYYATLTSHARSRDERAYLSSRKQSANWLVRSLDQRANSILKVATEIVRRQTAFLHEGIEHLRPLNLRDVAGGVGLHESTVSRVTTNKYMATPRGTYPLKFFFTSAIAAAEGGDAHSAEAVRHRIRGMIAAETADAVVSDDRIVVLLRQQGVDIARRTVAKYREAMGIPSSVGRRRIKQNNRIESEVAGFPMVERTPAATAEAVIDTAGGKV